MKDIVPIHHLSGFQASLSNQQQNLSLNHLNHQQLSSLNWNPNNWSQLKMKQEKGDCSETNGGESDQIKHVKSRLNHMTETGHLHTFFDPLLIQNETSCMETGVRSLVDVSPFFHYPSVGK